MDDLKSFHPGGDDVILGSGMSGTVHLYRHKVTNEPIAVKIFKLPADNDGMNRQMAYILEEADLLETLGRNDCFPSYLGCLQTSPGYVGLAMEFIGDVTNGESWTLDRGMDELDLTKKQWLKLAINISTSLGQMHEMGFLMNDLKDDNCLLRKTQTGQWEAVIIDFGLVSPRTKPFFCLLSDDKKEKYRRNENFVHLAPECALDDEATTTMSDVYQLGRLLKLMGDETDIAELNPIGVMCMQTPPTSRPTIEDVVDLLECMM
ncbi:uncharacterized protein LOC129281675 [Lytechinus pictus]|uniref:uncharacterized protein LOC129281675 n=1 Tax=Lytechinus pictus TaxID=7653 RepID=UPI0030B9F2B8